LVIAGSAGEVFVHPISRLHNTKASHLRRARYWGLSPCCAAAGPARWEVVEQKMFIRTMPRRIGCAMHNGYERSDVHRDTPAGHYERGLQTKAG
jgi:hypothetical protein